MTLNATLCNRRPRTRIALVTPIMVAILIGGCTSRRVYEIDTSSARRFDWTKRVRITEQPELWFGPFLSVSERWRVTEVELGVDVLTW